MLFLQEIKAMIIRMWNLVSSQSCWDYKSETIPRSSPKKKITRSNNVAANIDVIRYTVIKNLIFIMWAMKKDKKKILIAIPVLCNFFACSKPLLTQEKQAHIQTSGNLNTLFGPHLLINVYLTYLLINVYLTLLTEN